MSITVFGEIDDQPVHEVEIRSQAGTVGRILTYGALLKDLLIPCTDGQQRVVLGLTSLADYLAYSPSFGIIAGRYANRIALGKLEINGKTYQLDRNQAGTHTLHGGTKGFGKRIWQIGHHDHSSVTLTLVSVDGDMGFPGTLTVTVRYALLEPSTLRVEMTATTDAPTVVNLAHHTYWNLDGAPDILDHLLHVPGGFITPVDDALIPTGEIRDVAGTPFDFRLQRPVRTLMTDGSVAAFDHNWVLSNQRRTDGQLQQALTLRSSTNGMALEVLTTEPGVQIYTGSKLAVPVDGLSGVAYGTFAGMAIEPQIFPDSPNRPHFPNPLLLPGQMYRQVSEFRLRQGEGISGETVSAFHTPAS